MARRVSFGFHWAYVQRANVVRKAQTALAEGYETGFYDASLSGAARTRGPAGIERLIDRALKRSSVSAVLIGSQTAERPWVLYEVERSYTSVVASAEFTPIDTRPRTAESYGARSEPVREDCHQRTDSRRPWSSIAPITTGS
jgi:hypothetical protein